MFDAFILSRCTIFTHKDIQVEMYKKKLQVKHIDLQPAPRISCREKNVDIYIYIWVRVARSWPPPPEGEKFPVIALVYQHRRSASALFL